LPSLKKNTTAEKTLKKLTYKAEFINLQKWIQKNKMSVVVIFEGRDAAEKGGFIERFKEYLNPPSHRVVALQTYRS
jgi:polyphosphate kinase 2 (PPK2 family)